MIDSQVPIPNGLLLKPLSAKMRGSDRESLSSWLQATSAANHVSMLSVLNFLVMPRLPNKMHRDPTDWAPSNLPLNSGSSFTLGMCKVLGQLTGEKTLVHLTLEAWNHGPNCRPLLKPRFQKHWCPSCYSNDLGRYGRVYDRLAWIVEDVNICKDHSRALVHACSSCGKSKQKTVGASIVAGFCDHCRHWLGEESYPAGTVNELEEWDLWTAESVTGLLANPKSRLPDRSVENVSRMMSALCNFHHLGIAADMARHLGESVSNISGWINGKRRPRHERLRRISFAYRLQLGDLISGRVGAVALSTLRNPPPLRIGKKRKNSFKDSKAWSMQRVSTFIEECAADPKRHGMKSVAELARFAGWHPRSIRKFFRGEVARWQESLRSVLPRLKFEAREERIARAMEAVRCIIDEWEGEVFPSRTKIILELGKRGFPMAYEDCNEVLRRALTPQRNDTLAISRSRCLTPPMVRSGLARASGSLVSKTPGI